LVSPSRVAFHALRTFIHDDPAGARDAMRSVMASSARVLGTVPWNPTRVTTNSKTKGKCLFTEWVYPEPATVVQRRGVWPGA
jgi:hypothetical protein